MSEKNQLFKEAINRLNDRQKEAVEAIEGPVLVVAGPGTGKTQILTLRIANILAKTDTAPENILALTFTENAAANMRERLAKIISSPAYRVIISTFHSFCNDIIKNYPEEFPRIVGSTNINEIEQIKIIEQLIDTLDLDLLRPFGDPLLYVKPVLGAINELKREGITPAEFSQVVASKRKEFENRPDLYHAKGAHQGKMKGEYRDLLRDIDKNQELSLIYEGYEAALSRNRYYDYSDMIMEVLRELKTNERLLLSLQENHQYILVDEHQDTNNAQNKILELISNFHQSPNLFMVGDDKQAIFRFQGASLNNFYYFRKLYPEAKLIILADNYRSTQTILDNAHSLLPGEINLTARNAGEEKPIKVIECATENLEAFWVGQEISQLLKNGVEASQIAVLYRDNRDAFLVAKTLTKLGVGCVIESDDDLLNDLDIQKILILLKAIYYFDNSTYLAQALHVDWLNLQPLLVYQAIKEARDSNSLLIEVVEKTWPDLFAKLSAWNQMAHNLEVANLVEVILKESGGLEKIISQPNARERLETLTAWFGVLADVSQMNPAAKLVDLLEFLATVEKHQVSLKKRRGGSTADKIRLMTVHRSKGLEFRYVFIVGAFSGHFGGRASRSKLKLLPEVYQLGGAVPETANNDDERRLFFVALTRAKTAVFITYPKVNSAGKELIPSQFLGELRADLVDSQQVGLEIPGWSEFQISAFKPQQSLGTDLFDQEFVKRTFEEQGLSVTALNNYLGCPWRYFYRNLIRLPEPPERHQIFGLAVHAALNEAFKHAKDRGLSKENLLASFEQSLRQGSLTDRELGETLVKGREVLSGWFETYKNDFNFNVLTEFRIKGVELTPQIKLKGDLDKIEFLGEDNIVNVVDYKTGQPKSRNEILGETKNSEGNYYRQLVFYKLLLDLFDNGKYRMVSGEIDFIEPTESGKYKKEKFEITSEDLVDLKETIERVATEITTLAFWDKRCENKDCQYCALRELVN